MWYMLIFTIVALAPCISCFGLGGQKPPKINLGQQAGLFQGDLLVQRSKSPEGSKVQKFKKGRVAPEIKGGALPSYIWDNETIFYDFGDAWSKDQLDMLTGAMAEIQDNTCIIFKKRTNERNYVRIINDAGCFSAVGETRGAQVLSLHDSPLGTCWVHETVVHELLHAVGLFHEQMRPDVDQYMYLFLENVELDRRGNFVPCNSHECDTYGVPYNYLSVMHYDITAFGSNNKVTMLPKDTAFASALGGAKTGHPFDYETVRRMYKCPKEPLSEKNITCFQCETSSIKTNCKTGSCIGETCYTSVWPDRIVKGCGDEMYTFIGCRDSAQVGGANVVYGCKTEKCNEELPKNMHTLRCTAGLPNIRINAFLAFWGIVFVIGRLLA